MNTEQNQAGDWRSYLRQVTPYVPGEQPTEQNIIKLNTNENPYPPSPAVEKALKAMDPAKLRLYPDPTCGILTKGLAEYHGVGTDQVFVGVGSDDVLAMAFMTFFHSDRPIFFPDITYSFYPVWAELFRVPYETQAVDENFRLQSEDYHKENGGVIFPNPNAPTGLVEPLSFIEDILTHNRDVIVVVDEAYIDFGGVSALALLERYENLLVVRTYSKSRSMAGIRIGYAVGNAELIRAMQDVKYSFNSYTMNQAALELGAAALSDEAYFRAVTGKIAVTRDAAVKRLTEQGFYCLDSAANFIFAKHPKYEGEKLFTYLRQHGIYVRHFNGSRISQYLRITVGLDEEMERLYETLERAYGSL